MSITFTLRRWKRANDSAAQMWACCVAHHDEGTELSTASQLEDGWARICQKATVNAQWTSGVSRSVTPKWSHSEALGGPWEWRGELCELRNVEIPEREEMAFSRGAQDSMWGSGPARACNRSITGHTPQERVSIHVDEDQMSVWKRIYCVCSRG